MSYVLIVDDDEDFAASAATVLRAEGYEVGMEHTPESALARIRERCPDAIVLDVIFPESPTAGFELARTIRREFAGTPILVLTAVNQQFPLGFSRRNIDPVWLPVSDFVEKPIDFDVLCDAVKKLVGT